MLKIERILFYLFQSFLFLKLLNFFIRFQIFIFIIHQNYLYLDHLKLFYLNAYYFLLIFLFH